jgi:hypothetical protein
MTEHERAKAIELAIGRILRIAQRPTQPGDVEEYERCRALILDLSDGPSLDYTPNYARDRLKGAQGD